MTAIVAILNKNWVSIAADRTWSVYNWITYKSYDSNKLFRLSSTEPIWIATYQNLQFLWIPWEIIIKQYRKKLWNTTFQSLELYKDDFLNYLSTIQANDDKYIFYIIESSLKIIINAIKESLDFEISKFPLNKSSLEENEAIDIANVTIWNILNNLNQIVDLSRNVIDDSDIEIIFTENDNFEEIIWLIFWGMNLPVDTTNNILEIIKLEFKYNVFLNYNEDYPYSGIIITWFWSEDIFPSLIELKVYYRLNWKVLYTQVTNENISDDLDWTNAYIMPFAQDDVIRNIIVWVNPQIEKNLIDSIWKIIDSKVLDVNINKEIKESINNELGIIKSKYVSNVIDSVVHLPLSELWETAETLVNLTSFKRRVTMENETVWWDTDVAIISKSDWFIWKKRKHYFDKDLNSQYFKNNR